jgi:proteasome accessory factor B
MSKQTFITRFSLIIKRLERGPATFEQIAHYLKNESELQDKNFNLSIRTLQRDIKNIYEQLGIEIVNEKKGDKRYFIKGRPEGEEHSRRLLEAYDTLNIVKESQQNNQYIYFEPRSPKGLEHFHGLLHACSNKKILNFTHHKYWNNTQTNRTVHPLALKESRGRWYLVAIDTKDNLLKTFGLDRMEDLNISKTSFKNNYKINIEEVFYHAFGIINDTTTEPEKIILSLSHEQGQYLKTYPLHHTQQVVSETADEIIVELNLLITFDFVMELQSFGPNLKVMFPKRLIKMLVDNSRQVIGMYGK